jgi:tricorn protease
MRMASLHLSVALLGLLVLAAPGFGADVDLPRYPSISPDGSQIVFSWRGDLWLVPVDGGDARRLTVHPGIDSRSAWHPDGSEIAFESDRDGYRNVWAIKPDGSGVRQVVKTDRYALLNDYGSGPGGPDDPTITFDARLEGDFYRSGRPYQVATEGGPFTRVHDAYGSAASRSPSGEQVLFERGGSSWTRRHYRGPDSRDVWLQSPDGSFNQLTSWAGNDGNPDWLDEDSMVFMSDRKHDTVNLYRQSVVPGVEDAHPLTAFTDRDITAFDLSGDGRTAIIQRWDTLYSLDLTDPDASPVPLRINANEDGLDRVVPTDVSRRVTEAALSPDGKVMATVAYGDVWVRNVEDGSPTRRITRTLAHDRDIAWSPDGLRLYFVSDEDGMDAINEATVRRTRKEIREAWTSATDPEKAGDTDDTDEEASPDQQADAAAGEIEGAWTIIADIPGIGAVEMSVTFTPTDGDDWDVSFSSPVYSGSGTATYDPDTAKLTLALTIDNGPTVTVEATVEGDTLSGTASTPDGKMGITGSRDAPPDADDQDDGDEQDEETTKKDEDAKDDDTKDDDTPDPAHDPERWHDAIEFDINPVVAGEFNNREPKPSPDGTKLAYRRGRGDIRLLDLVTDEDSRLHESWDFWSSYTWSPDSSSIAMSVDDRNFNSDIWLVPIDDPDAAVNISRHPDNDINPSFSSDGRILVFTSERKDEAYDVYRVYLDKSLEGMLEPELDAYYADAVKAAKKRKPIPVRTPEAEGVEKDDAEQDDAEKDDAEQDDAEKDDADAELTPDWTPSLHDAYLRLQRRSSLPGNEQSALVTHAGDRIIYSNSGGGPGDSGLWSVKWDGTDAKRIGSGSMQHLSTTGDKVITVSGGAGWIPVAGGSSKSLPLDAEIDIDLEEQSRRKFAEAVRIFEEVFYHPEMNGIEWDRISDDYQELAGRAWTGDEFNWVAARLLGELNASHTGIRASGYSSKLSRSQGRLGTVHRAHPDGFEIMEIVDDSPAAVGPMPLEVGDVIVSIEGEPIKPQDTLERRLQGKVGEEVIIGIRRSIPTEGNAEGNAEGNGEADEPAVEVLELDALMKPITGPAYERLQRTARERGAQSQVDASSDGRIGYLHIESMNQASLDEFERDLYAVAEGRDGLIIDVRNNGGGWTADRLLASIMTRPHAYTVPRGADPSMRTGYPQDRLFIQRYVLPINMLCNEKSFSNAEITSHAFKNLERGTLVGEQTYGGVISTGGTSLVDGTSIRLPFRGWYLLDGTDMENNGAMPDLVVPQTPEDESSGTDTQLQVAIDDLMKRLPPKEEQDD